MEGDMAKYNTELNKISANRANVPPVSKTHKNIVIQADYIKSFFSDISWFQPFLSVSLIHFYWVTGKKNRGWLLYFSSSRNDYLIQLLHLFSLQLPILSRSRVETSRHFLQSGNKYKVVVKKIKLCFSLLKAGKLH